MFGKKSTRDMVGGGQASTPQTQTKNATTVKVKKGKEKRPKRKSEAPSLFRNRMFLGVMSIGLALFIAFGVTPVVNMLTSRDIEAVRLKADVPKGTVLTAEQIETVSINARNLGQYIVTDPAQAVGKYAAIDMLRGDILTEQKVTDAIQYDDPYLAALPEDKMAISVAMQSPEESLSGKLRAGDIVRLYAYMTDSLDTSEYNALSLPELQYVEVLAVTNGRMRDLDTKNDLAEAETEEAAISTVTLAVNTQQASVLAGLNQCAQLHAALVSRGDEARKAASLEAQDQYFRTIAPPAANVSTDMN